MFKRIRSRGPLLVPLLIASLVATALVAACSDAGVDSGVGEAPLGEPGAEPAPAEVRDVAGDEAGAGTEAGGLGPLNDRKIVRTATIDLRVEDLQGSVVAVQAIATRAGGFVSESRVFVAPDSDEDDVRSSQSATVVIRVPAETFEDTMSKLRDAADEVESETISATEVTEEFTDLESRLRNLEATELQYLALLERAESIEDVLAVQARLDDVRLEIEQVQGRLNVLADLTDLATITVNLTPTGAPAGDEDDNWAVEALETAWDVSLDALIVLGTAAIAAAVLFVWLIALGAVLVPAWRLFGRRAVSLAKRIYNL